MAHAGFCFLATTKTGSTALEAAYSEYAQITTRRPAPLKHMSAKTFEAQVTPLLARYGYPRESYALVCLAREPVSWVLSWYRYRSRRGARGNPNYTGETPFADFVAQILDGSLNLGSASNFVHTRDGVRLVEHVVRYEQLAELGDWMAHRLQVPPQPLAPVNVSPVLDVDVAPALRARLEEHYAADVALYESAGLPD